jgi:hypothetical protein
MRVVAPGKVWLEKGEVCPVACQCGWVYKPPEGSEASTCPACGGHNDHELQRLKEVEE